MYGYGANHNKLIKSAREKIPGFFVFQALQAFPGVTGVPHGNRAQGRGTGNGNRAQVTA